MNEILRTTLVVLGINVTAALAAQAQIAPLAGPADPGAPAPTLKHESAFEGYRRFQEPDIESWSAANRAVGALRGHVDHVKEVAPSIDKSTEQQARDGRSAASPPQGRSAK